MIRLKLSMYCLTSMGFGNFVLAAVQTSESVWLAIISILMGILTIGLGALIASYMKHIENHPGVTINECKIKHEGLEKTIKLNTLYLKTLIEHNGLQNKVEKLKEEQNEI